MRTRSRSRSERLAPGRSGFTLVEMLVSVTLVLMMMMMFAQVFEIAAGMHVKIRGVTRNDQRTRILTRILRSDLDKRTMRNTTPFRIDEHLLTTLADRDLDNRQGYFSVSENNPESDLDDVLQFTARTSISLQNVDSTRFSGKSTNLGAQLLRQPDWDDGVDDNVTESIAAEVSYFLRSGTLFRRVLLLRQPAYGGDQPTDAAGNLMMTTYANLVPARSFWNDFDCSAHFEAGLGVRFHGLASLDNSGSLENYPLGFRNYRFGHNCDMTRPGFAREFTVMPGAGNDGQWGTADDGAFIGRFTHEETSKAAFSYPRIVNAQNPNPLDDATQLTMDADRVVTGYRNGPRRAEDVLMTDVHSFDIKVLHDAYAPYSRPETSDRDFDTRHPRNSSLPTTYPYLCRPWTPSTAYNANNPPIVRTAGQQGRFGLWYRGVNYGTSGPVEPNWPTIVGQRVLDGNIIWEAIYDPHRALAIQVTVLFLDRHSGHMRQATILHSLTN